ncbi:hypothetical protein EES37_20760 [Streptomyces sp. ADI91-18]|nr:hypothetical protein EES37_20760 [Streptomyces sp. ADI91-18]
MRGVAYVSRSATSRKASSMPSMWGEWKAWLTVRRLVFRSGNASATASAASSSPATTTELGPLTAAMPTRSVSIGRTSSSEASTAIMTPPDGSACIRRPRAATSVQASASDRTPATCAAAISPME